MNKLLALVLALLSFSAFGAANDFMYTQRNATDTGNVIRIPPHPTTASGLFLYDITSDTGYWALLGSGLNLASGTLSVVPGAVAWTDVTGKPSFALVATSGAYADLSGKPTIPTITAFNFGTPNARTLAVSTDYQATDPSKAAVVSVSPSCTNATTVLAASACTLQTRIGTSTVTCSTGTIVNTWASTYALGLLLTNTSGSPFDIKLPIGGHFILCATAGTFTFPSAVDQSAS